MCVRSSCLSTVFSLPSPFVCDIAKEKAAGIGMQLASFFFFILPLCAHMWGGGGKWVVIYSCTLFIYIFFLHPTKSCLLKKKIQMVKVGMVATQNCFPHWMRDVSRRVSSASVLFIVIYINNSREARRCISQLSQCWPSIRKRNEESAYAKRRLSGSPETRRD